jgi:cell wall-associated NlpC family hydrolase
MDIPFIVTWNTLGAGNTNSKIKEGLNSFVNRGVDVVCLQEMSDDNRHNAARDYMNSRGFQKVNSTAATPIFVRKSTWQIIDQRDVLVVNGPHTVEDGTGGRTFGDKHTNWVKIRNVKTSKIAYVVNNHFYPGIDNGSGGFTSKKERARWARVQMNAAIEMTSSWRAAKTPVFITGDYNLTYNPNSELVTKMKSAGFTSNWAQLGAKATHTTRTIDYIWSANATPVSQTLPGKYGSDHTAVIVSFINGSASGGGGSIGAVPGSVSIPATSNAVVPQNSIGNIYVMGQKLKSNLREAITSAKISGSFDQVTQLTLNVVDPGFRVLHSGVFAMGTPVRYQDLSFVIASQTTQTIGGVEGLEIICRPKTVSDLKRRRGAKVMSSVSPSEFVVAECKAVGAKYHVQNSARRAQVARDVPISKERYSAASAPSSWTTFQRLAQELGYICFEVAGVIHFGKPSYFAALSKKTPSPRVHWTDSHYGDSRIQAEEVPTCTRSEDSTQGVTVSMKLPPQRSPQFRIGRLVQLTGVTSFSGYYLIDSIDFDLAGNNRLTVTAGTTIDPVAQPPDGTTVGGDSGAQIINETIANSWPLPTKYKVTTPFGKKGSWAAGFHTGADFACPTGTPVYAVYDGKILSGNWGGDYGNHIILEVGTKQYAYCHLSKKSVAAGKTVKAGQILGYSGATGRVTGPHLHLELRYKPFKYNNVCKDPIPTLRQGGTKSGTLVVTKPAAGNYGGTSFDSTQLRVATDIVSVGAGLRFSDRGLTIALMTAMQESSMRELNYGDRDSIGPFQQRAAWGSHDDRLHAKTSAQMFFKGGKGGQRGLEDISGWEKMSLGQACQKVQVSAHPSAYSKWEPEAKAILAKINPHITNGGTTTTPSNPSGSENSKRATDMVTWALSRVGISRYVYGATRDTSNRDLRVFDCSSLIRWACARVGVYMPYNTRDQEPYLKGSGGTKISLDKARGIRGAVFYKPGVHCAISLGNGKTVEASTPSLGIRQASSYNRGFVNAYTIDALRY